jgi:sugar phosphate isomerase/epimerase
MNQDSFAISTTWNSYFHSDVKEMLNEIKGIGLDTIEIGYNFNSRRLKELISLINMMGIKIVSVHNFCPMPSGVRLNRFSTDYYRLSSLNERERRRAVDYTKKSIDTACLVSSQAVVIHAGTVELNKNYVRTLLNLYNEDKINSEEYREAKQRLLAARQDKIAGHLESVVRSLREILSYVKSTGVKIGLETRYYPNEIPNIEETEYLLNLFKNKGLVYWHDVGHAETNERLGIASHTEYLNKFADYMMGIHLHDIKGIDDHLAPFSGDFNFSKLDFYMMPDGLIKVIEAHPPATAQQIRESIKRLKQKD